MEILLNIIRILTAVIAPAAVVCLTALSSFRIRKDESQAPEDAQQECLRCGESRTGAEGQFHYSENFNSARERSIRKQLTLSKPTDLGSETHFICDRCAYRYIMNENLQLILMALPYPLYLFIIVPLFAQNGVFANFLVETLLIVLSVGGFISALDLFRAVCGGVSPLSDARDHVAIQQRKQNLGKNFNYYTRVEMTHLKK